MTAPNQAALGRDTTIREPHPPDLTEADLVQWNNMVAGRVYNPIDPYILSQRKRCEDHVRVMNGIDDLGERSKLQAEYCGKPEVEGGVLYWLPPFFSQYVSGSHRPSPARWIRLHCTQGTALIKAMAY